MQTRALLTRTAVLAATVATAAACATGDAVPAPVAPAAATPLAAPPAAASRPAAPTADQLAGVLDASVPPSGPGTLAVVPGSAPAPARSRTMPVRVEVEDGLRIDGDAFATFVLTTLNDSRGWGRDGDVGFARTDGEAPIQVLLATPATTDRLCAGLRTGGRLSCRRGPRAVLNVARWVTGIPDYRGNPTGYRQYMINHEVGHVLGYGHVSCPAAGRPAPVMQQQTFGLDGCRQNPWPFP